MPISEESTELYVEWLFPKDTLADPNYDIKNVTDFAILVMGQDADISEVNQKGLRNKAFKNGTLMPEEYTIKAFHDWVKSELEK